MKSDHQVYVMLGFHTSFHHSWRGDTADEAGFGTDIRIVRQILRILDEANENGLQARGYWDFDVYWTLEQIIPYHAPDLIDRIGRRVADGRDEIVLGPYNNGANHAATERELRAAISYAVENPYGSGLRQIFGQTATLFRPQESMYTAGQNAIFLEEGVSGLVLYYAGIPFNALSTFIPTLPPEQRYNPFRLRSRPEEAPITVWPCISPGDLVDHVSLEALMLHLRQLQTSGQVQSDLLIHVNSDADGESWLPAPVPRAFAWFPNTGGLAEYIRAVNRYPWASFTIPSDYVKDHPPQAELLARQDLADGGFDGSYSWAEKHSSLQNWTLLERSRLHSYRAEALARRIPEALAEDLHRRLWEGRDSAFFRRLVGLTTTHFGMSTPVINEERQARAAEMLGGACEKAIQAERNAALVLRSQAPRDDAALYVFEVFQPEVPDRTRSDAVQAVVRVPVILPAGVGGLQVEDTQGRAVVSSLVNVAELGDDSLAAELIAPAGAKIYRARPAPAGPTSPSLDRLQNPWLSLHLSEGTGIASLTFRGQPLGSSRFLEPFITYRSGRRARCWRPSSYERGDLAGEVWHGLTRAQLRTRIEMETPQGPATTHLQYTFTLFDRLPYLLVDVEVAYARTAAKDTIHTLQQKLRRLLDLRWIEVAPFQLQPEILSVNRPLRVWKHNYLGITSHYDLDYSRINPKNRELDSFNHQVTAGWVAVSNGRLGLLLAESAEALASMAFCPMRLREHNGIQHLSLNPFGSYHGRQLDYSHLGGSGVGAEFATGISGALRPNGPSFNGQRMEFSLLLAPYQGDEPPPDLQAAALAFFYPAGVVYLKTPPEIGAVLPGDLRQLVAARESRQQPASGAPLPAPHCLLASPADAAVDLVWEADTGPRATACQIRWREEGAETWQSQEIPFGNRWQVAGLRNGQGYTFQVRLLAGDCHSAWSGEARAEPGPVGATSPFSAISAVSPWTLLRLVGYSLAHVLRSGIERLAGRYR